MSKICLVVAYSAEGRVIGNKGGIPWEFIPKDMQRFVKITKGHPVVMGRKTWDSLPEDKRPLKNRTNIVLTRDPSFTAEGVIVARTPTEALAAARASAGSDEIMIIGGGELYRAFLPLASRIYATRVHVDVEGDTFMPVYEQDFPVRIDLETIEDNPRLEFITCDRA